MARQERGQNAPPARDTISNRDPNSQRTKDGRAYVGRQRQKKGAIRARTIRGTKDNPWPEVVRERIRTSKVLERLIDCAEGALEMSPTQARVGLGLVDKVLPTLTENKNENTGEMVVVERRRFTDSDTDT